MLSIAFSVLTRKGLLQVLDQVPADRCRAGGSVHEHAVRERVADVVLEVTTQGFAATIASPPVESEPSKIEFTIRLPALFGGLRVPEDEEAIVGSGGTIDQPCMKRLAKTRPVAPPSARTYWHVP